MPFDSTTLPQSCPTSCAQMLCHLPGKWCTLNSLQFAGLTNTTCQKTNGPINLMRSSSPRLLLSFSFKSLQSNNCPPLPRKTLVPLENSITRLHKRFKIMVLRLCGEREQSWLWLKQEQTFRHLSISGRQSITY